MPPVNIANSALVAVKGRVNTQKVVNVFCYRKISGAPTAADIDALATWWGNVGWFQMRNVLPAGYTSEEVDVRSVHPGLAYQRVIPSTGVQNGLRLGDMEQGVTAPINWATATASRSSRGRTEIGPPVEGDVNGETISTNLVNFLLNFAAYLVVQHPGGVWQFSIGSRKLHIAYPVIAAVIKALTGTMASRLTRR